MLMKSFLTVVFIVCLLNLCKVNAIPVKHKAAPENTSQTAGINTKRHTMSPVASGSSSSSSMDAGGLMLQMLKDYEAKQHKQDDPSVENPADPPATGSDETTFKEGIKQVNANLEAFVDAVKGDDSILGEIEKTDLPLIRGLLKQLEDQFDTKNITPSQQTFSKLVNAVEVMAGKVVEENDDSRLHKLLTALNNSLCNLALSFKQTCPSNATKNPSAGKPNGSSVNPSSPDLGGVADAINGNQEA